MDQITNEAAHAYSILPRQKLDTQTLARLQAAIDQICPNSVQFSIAQPSKLYKQLSACVSSQGNQRWISAYQKPEHAPVPSSAWSTASSPNYMLSTTPRSIPSSSATSPASISGLDRPQSSSTSVTHYNSQAIEHNNSGAGFTVKVSSFEQVYAALSKNILPSFNKAEICGLVKLLIKNIENFKQTKYPYKGRDTSRPPWWPTGVPHKEPDHLVKNEVQSLTIFIFGGLMFRVAMQNKVYVPVDLYHHFEQADFSDSRGVAMYPNPFCLLAETLTHNAMWFQKFTKKLDHHLGEQRVQQLRQIWTYLLGFENCCLGKTAPGHLPLPTVPSSRNRPAHRNTVRCSTKSSRSSKQPATTATHCQRTPRSHNPSATSSTALPSSATQNRASGRVTRKTPKIKTEHSSDTMFYEPQGQVQSYSPLADPNSNFGNDMMQAQRASHEATICCIKHEPIAWQKTLPSSFLAESRLDMSPINNAFTTPGPHTPHYKDYIDLTDIIHESKLLPSPPDSVEGRKRHFDETVLDDFDYSCAFKRQKHSVDSNDKSRSQSFRERDQQFCSIRNSSDMSSRGSSRKPVKDELDFFIDKSRTWGYAPPPPPGLAMLYSGFPRSCLTGAMSPISPVAQEPAFHDPGTLMNASPPHSGDCPSCVMSSNYDNLTSALHSSLSSTSTMSPDNCFSPLDSFTSPHQDGQ